VGSLSFFSIYMPLDFTLNDSTTQNCWQLSRATSHSSAARFGSTLEIRKRQPENNNNKKESICGARGVFSIPFSNGFRDVGPSTFHDRICTVGFFFLFFTTLKIFDEV
jgi:hypothetical protein